MKVRINGLVAFIMVVGCCVPMLSAAQAQTQEGGAKAWLLSAAMSRGTLGRFEVNLKTQGSIAIEGGYLGAREMLSPNDIEKSPGDSLMSYGHEYKVMISRYTQGAKMGGFFWGLGVGQRSMEADWRKSPYAKAPGQIALADEDGKVTHRLQINGTMLEGRAGYRYVGDSGVVAGLFLDVVHHNNKVKDRDSVLEAEEGDHIAAVAEHDAYALSRRSTSTLAPGFEFGWAF